MKITIELSNLDDALEMREALKEHRERLVRQKEAARVLGTEAETERKIRSTNNCLSRMDVTP